MYRGHYRIEREKWKERWNGKSNNRRDVVLSYPFLFVFVWKEKKCLLPRDPYLVAHRQFNAVRFTYLSEGG